MALYERASAQAENSVKNFTVGVNGNPWRPVNTILTEEHENSSDNLGQFGSIFRR